MIETSMSTTSIIKVASLSRLGIILLQLIGNSLIPDHVSLDAFNPPPMTNSTPSSLQKITSNLLGGFNRWDAIHFTHISQFGYIFEHNAAFFPMYPLSVHLFTIFLLQSNTLFLLSSIFLNFVYFNVTAVYLYKLTQCVFMEKNIAPLTLFLFCLNPANVFFSAPYSESLFSMLTFTGLYLLYSNSFYLSLIPIGFSSFCRSNGLLNVGYLLYFCTRCYLSRGKHNFVTFTVYFSKCLLSVVVIIAGFFVYQYYIYLILCERDLGDTVPAAIRKYAQDNNYKLVADFIIERWCFKFLPVAYSYIQARYWQVGFLTYWTWRQLPNFLLATPVILLSTRAVLTFFKSVSAQKLFDLFGMIIPFQIESQFTYKNNSNVYPFAVHMIVLLVAGLFYMHVQVSTRFIFSSNPLIYWYLAYLLNNEYLKQLKKQKYKALGSFLCDLIQLKQISSRWVKFLIIYFISYTFFGTLLFVNFYPFT